MKKQAVYAGFGFAYAVIYGLWVMLITGGGHGNFIWFQLFCYASLFGLYFPVMGALYTDLENKGARIVFLALLGFHIVASSALLVSWTFGFLNDFFFDGFDETVKLVGPTSLIFFAVLHYLPTLVLTILYFRTEKLRHLE